LTGCAGNVVPEGEIDAEPAPLEGGHAVSGDLTGYIGRIPSPDDTAARLT
jgi:hypothetical protein